MSTNFSIEEVVDVIIAVGDRPVDSRDFGTPLILTTTNHFTDQVVEVTTTAQVSALGFSTASPIYKMVSNCLGKTFSPKRVLIGKRFGTGYGFFVNFSVLNSTAYTVNISVINRTTSVKYNKSFTYTSDTTATDTEIATELSQLIEADADIAPLVTATVDTNKLVISPVNLNPLSVGAVTTNCWVTEDGDQTAADAIDVVYDNRQDFFYVLSTDQSTTAQLSLAAWAESNKRVYYASSSASDVYASGSSDILSQLMALQYNNTAFISSLLANIDYPDAALIGATASVTPGASDLYAKTLVGSSVSNFNGTQLNYVKSKNGNAYILRGGVGWFEPGDAVSGRAMDITIGALYLEARMEEALFGLIKRESDLGRKINYNDQGIQTCDSVVRSELEAAIVNSFITRYNTYPPLAETVSDADKANRVLNIPFEAELAGSIRGMIIRGFIQLSL